MIDPQASRDVSPRGDDIVAINEWLSVTRIRAAGAAAVFVSALAYLQIGPIRWAPVMLVASFMVLFSALALRLHLSRWRPWLFFYVQTIVDIIGVTVGIALVVDGRPGILFSTLYVLIIVPSSLASVRTGLLAATLASVGHLALLYQPASAPASIAAIDAVLPVFLFFLVAQQCFFYAGHLARKNRDLAALASNVDSHRQRLENLVRIARTLNSTVEAGPLLAKTNQAALEQLRATSSATFLVDAERRTFRLAALSAVEARSGDFSRIDFPIAAFPAVEELGRNSVAALSPDQIARVPVALTAGRRMSSIYLAGLRRKNQLVGFLAIGYGDPESPAEDVVREQLAAIAEHSTIALGNARLLEEAREASALKSEFVSTVSHELRTPLNVIIGYTEMLRDGAAGTLTKQQDALFRRIEASSRELFDLIEAVLQVGRLDTGGAAPVLAPVSMAALLKTLEGGLGGLPRPPAVDFAWEVPPNLRGTIVTDAPKLALVARNLVGNALKFTPSGRVVLRLQPDGDRLVLEVEDTGVGIAAENVERIFEMFRQLTGGESRGGVGLGLHIVKQIVARLGGTIEVDSEVGVGSCFRVTLPRFVPFAEPGDEPAERPGAPAVAASAGR